MADPSDSSWYLRALPLATMVALDRWTARLAGLKEVLGISPRPSVVVAHLDGLGLRFPLDIRCSVDVFSMASGRSPGRRI